MATSVQRGCLRLFVFLLFVAVSTQQVYLQPSNTSNPECSDGGVVDGKDHVVMIGFVTADGTTPLIFDFVIKRVGDASATQVCKIDVGTDGCGSQSTALCYCQGVSNNTYTVVYNITASEEDSNATLTLSYEGDSSVQQLPIVCIIQHEESDDPCSVVCIVVIPLGGLLIIGGVVFGYIYGMDTEIATCDIIIEVSSTLKELETKVIQDVRRRTNKLRDGEKVFIYEGQKLYNKNMQLKDLFPELSGSIEVTVKVFRKGTFVINEGAAVGSSANSYPRGQSVSLSPHNLETETPCNQPESSGMPRRLPSLSANNQAHVVNVQQAPQTLCL